MYARIPCKARPSVLHTVFHETEDETVETMDTARGDMDSILSLFNFSGKLDADLHITPQPAQQRCDIIRIIEDSSARGDLPAVEKAFAELQTSPGGDLLAHAPGSALLIAIQNQYPPIVEHLLEHGAHIGENHIKIATLKRNTVILDLLLAYGWDVNMQLEWASPPPMALAVENSSLTAWFLSHGANPDARCLLDYTPLSAAVQYASLAVIKSMFDHGGSIHVGQLLHYAVRRESQDSLEVLAYILSKGPAINDIMYQRDLVSHGQQMMFSLGTALHEAAERGKVEVVQVLVEHGANPSIKDTLGHTSMDRAERAGRHSIWVYLNSLTPRSSTL
ncbi:hypothetical protein LTR12_016417 [Friedmanniomyces endolithicus]|nr:hypothetical protein LTR12_016417 [Friedmanniomyces endolithicus]